MAIQDLQKQMLGIEGLLKEVTENHGRMLITLRGIGHDRICYLGHIYLERGYITRSEYENLHDQLYVPYRDMGGNGTAKKIMDEVSQLKIKERES